MERLQCTHSVPGYCNIEMACVIANQSHAVTECKPGENRNLYWMSGEAYWCQLCTHRTGGSSVQRVGNLTFFALMQYAYPGARMYTMPDLLTHLKKGGRLHKQGQAAWLQLQHQQGLKDLAHLLWRHTPTCTRVRPGY